MDFTILHFAIHIVWRVNVICICRNPDITRKTTVAYPELRLIVNNDYQVVIRAYVYVLEIAAIYDIPFLMAKSRFLFYHPVEGVA